MHKSHAASPELRLDCQTVLGALRLHAAFTITAPWTVLFGPSGSGKSSLLRLIAGVWQPSECHVSLSGKDLTRTLPHQRRIALIAQDVALFPHRTVLQNLTFAIPTQHTATALEEANRILRRLQIDHVAAQYPRQLSGGEAQRVAIARALAMGPQLLLLDEVFTGLSTSLALTLRSELRSWQHETGVPILSVTHDVAEALEADEVIRLEAGGVIAQGHPSQVLHAEREALLRRLSASARP